MMWLHAHGFGPGAGAFQPISPQTQTTVVMLVLLLAILLVAWWLRPSAERGPIPPTIRVMGEPVVDQIPLADFPGSADKTRFLQPWQLVPIVTVAWDELDVAIQHGLRDVGIEIETEPMFERGSNGEIRSTRGQFVRIGSSRTIRLCWPWLASTTDEDIQRVFWHEVAHAAGMSHADLEPYGL